VTGPAYAVDARGRTGDGPSVPRVRMRGIRKSFGSIEALRGVDLDLWPGEVLGLVGDNAAGKSTLTKILAGAYLPDDGTIELDGRQVRFGSPAEARARRVEMVYQDLSLCDTVDVAGNLFLGREPTRTVLGLRLLNKPRMVAEARATLDSLEIQIPNLKEVDAVLRLIRRVRERGVSVILITHRLQDLFRVCDRIMVLYEGVKVAERGIDETDLEDLVQLIVGERMRAATSPDGT
jgi:simple sugar transport system ATP-binding protein